MVFMLREWQISPKWACRNSRLQSLHWKGQVSYIALYFICTLLYIVGWVGLQCWICASAGSIHCTVRTFHVYTLMNPAHVTLATFTDEVAIALLLSLGEGVGGLGAHIRYALNAVSSTVSGNDKLGLPSPAIPNAKSSRVDVSKWLGESVEFHTSRDGFRRYLDRRSDAEGLSADEESLAQFCLAPHLVNDQRLLVFGPWLPSLISSSGLAPHSITDSKHAIEVIKQCENVVASFGHGVVRPKILTVGVIAEASAIKEAHENGDWVNLATRIVALAISRTDHLEIMKVHARAHTHEASVYYSVLFYFFRRTITCCVSFHFFP